MDEMYAFIGILIYAGAAKLNLVAAKDLFHKSHMPFYRGVMSLERFEQISRCLRFDDSRTRDCEKISWLQFVIHGLFSKLI